MNVILDLLVIFIAGLTIFLAVKKGFVKTFFSATAFLLAVIITMMFMSPVKDAFLHSSLGEKVEKKAEESVSGFLTFGEAHPDETNYEVNVEQNIEFLKKIGIDSAELEEKIVQWRQQGDLTISQLEKKASDYVTGLVVNAIISFTAGLILFIGSYIIIRLIGYALDKACRLPGLHAVNKSFGFVLGVVLAIIRVFMFVMLIKMLIPYAGALDWKYLADIDPDKTLLFKLFYNFNIFDFMLK